MWICIYFLCQGQEDKERLSRIHPHSRNAPHHKNRRHTPSLILTLNLSMSPQQDQVQVFHLFLHKVSVIEVPRHR